MTDDILKRERPDLTEDQITSILMVAYLCGELEEKILLQVADHIYPKPSQTHSEPV